MHTYDALTNTGLMIHLSMKTETQCYILVYDTYTQSVNMKFFTNREAALYFIRTIE
jgi:hypothetical protein